MFTLCEVGLQQRGCGFPEKRIKLWKMKREGEGEEINGLMVVEVSEERLYQNKSF